MVSDFRPLAPWFLPSRVIPANLMMAVIVTRVDGVQRYNQAMGMDLRLDGLSEQHDVLTLHRRLPACNMQNIKIAAQQAGTNIRPLCHIAEIHEPGPTYEH
jgi:hypothetical protein